MVALTAQSDGGETDGFLFRATGDVTIGLDETISSVIVADRSAVVEGEVTDFLMVTGGTATVDGTVGGDIVMIDADLNLGQAATVENVTLFDSSLDRAEGAIIAGDLSEEGDLTVFGWGAFVFSVMMWIGFMLLLIVAAVLFAWLGRRPLTSAGEVLEQRVGASLLTPLVLLIGLPLLVVLAFATVIGIPIGLAVFVVVIPALWLFGYLVASAKIGTLLLRPTNVRNLMLAAALGVLLLQVLTLIPALGPLVAFLATTYGAGGLVYWMIGQPGRPQATAAQPRSRPVA